MAFKKGEWHRTRAFLILISASQAILRIYRIYFLSVAIANNVLATFFRSAKSYFHERSK